MTIPKRGLASVDSEPIRSLVYEKKGSKTSLRKFLAKLIPGNPFIQIPHRSGMPRKRNSDDSAYAAATMDELLVNRMNLNRVTTDFLKVDVATALTFTGIALQTDDSIKKERNQRAARRAYDSVLRLARKVQLTDDDAKTLSGNLERLRGELETLGEVF